MSNFETVGERIRHLRKDHLELTLKEMSEKLNVSLSNLGNVETGVIKATDRLLSDICREFGVSIHWLEDGEGGIFKERTTYEKLADFTSAREKAEAYLEKYPDDTLIQREYEFLKSR